MLWTAFTLAFFGFLRCSEFTCSGTFDITSHMSRSDITFQPSIFRPSSLEVTIKKSKTDPFPESAKLIIAKSNSMVCAVTALRDYMLQTSTQGPAQPLFQFCDGRYLTCSPTRLWCEQHPLCFPQLPHWSRNYGWCRWST